MSGGGPDSSAEVSGQEGKSLSSYSQEGLARKQRDEPAFRWLVRFLKAGMMPQNNEFILSGPEKCYYLERGQLRMHKEGVIWRLSSPDPDRLLIPSSVWQEVMSTVHDIPCSGHQGVQHTKANAREMFYWWKMGTRSQIRAAPETSQQLQAPESQKHKRWGGRRKRYVYCVMACKTNTFVVFFFFM